MNKLTINKINTIQLQSPSTRLVGYFGFNGPLRQYFSLYRAVSQREGGERGEKGQMRVKMSKQPPPAPTASAVGPCPTEIQIVGRPDTGSLPSTIAPPPQGERGERIDESKNVQTTPTRTYCKRNRPLPYCNQNCRTPRHWKFTQHHRTTRPPPSKHKVTLIVLYKHKETYIQTDIKTYIKTDLQTNRQILDSHRNQTDLIYFVHLQQFLPITYW